MKVLFFANYSPLESVGGGVCTMEILKGLGNKNEIILLMPFKEKQFVYPNVRVVQSIRIPKIFTHNISHFLNLYDVSKLLKKIEVDAILAQYSPYHYAALAALIINKVKRVPIVIRAEDIIPSQPTGEKVVSSYFMKYCYAQFTNLLTLNLAKYGDRILVMSSELKNLLIKRGYPASMIRINPNGADITQFTIKNKTYFKDKYGVEKIILFAGGMQPTDRTQTLVKAFSLLLTEYPSILLLFVGEGPMVSKDRALSKKMGISDKVIFLGQIPHKYMPDILANADVCIGPLRPTLENRLTVPVKIVEYMACGKPVVSIQVSEDILKNGVTGIAIQQANPKELATGISMILSDDVLARRLGSQARSHIEKNFTWNSIVSNLEGELMEVAH